MKAFKRCFHAQNKALKFFVFLFLGIIGIDGFACWVSNHGIMMLESEEPKTLKDEPIFNRVRHASFVQISKA